MNNPFEGDPDFLYLALDRKKMMEEAPAFDAKTSCWIVDHKEGYMKANIISTKGDDVTVLTDAGEVCSAASIYYKLVFVCIENFWNENSLFQNYFKFRPNE